MADGDDDVIFERDDVVAVARGGGRKESPLTCNKLMISVILSASFFGLVCNRRRVFYVIVALAFFSAIVHSDFVVLVVKRIRMHFLILCFLIMRRNSDLNHFI